MLLFSGAAGLMYQVAWVRLLGLTFGVTIFAISTVLAAFMGGLALGSVVGGRYADRIRRPLRAYGLIELVVGATALTTPALFQALQSLYREVALLADPTQAPLIAGLVRVILAFVILLVPTALMGATLPLAVRGVRLSAARGVTANAAVDAAGSADESKAPEGAARGDTRAMGLLYALNTSGAIVGALTAGFVLIGGYGLRTTVLVAAACNLLAGVGGLALSALVERRTAHVPAQAPPAERVTPVQAATGDTHAARLARVAFWAFGISGGVSLAYEVTWARILAILFDSSIYGFVLMLGTVLAGIAIGSAAAAALLGWRSSLRGTGRAFGWIEIGIGLAAVLSLAGFGQVLDWLGWLRETGNPLFLRLLSTEARVMAMMSVLTVLPAALLMGASFPVAARLWVAGRGGTLASRLGGIYAANTVGAIVGSTAAGFVLIPVLGAHASLLVLAGVNLAVGAALLWAAGPPFALKAAFPVAASAGVALGVGAIAWGATRPPVHEVVFRQRFVDHKLEWYREGLENTVSMALGPEGEQRMYTNSRNQTNDKPDLVRYQRVMGFLATVLSPAEQQRVLVVGIGGGATPGAIAQFSSARLDLVELSEAVVAAAPFFNVASNNVLQKPNVKLTIDDGRNWLLRNRQPYDIITADIVPPYDAGSNNLYSVEYFKLAARALAPDGLMVQWVSPENAYAHQLVIRTFLQAFPNATLWLGGDLLIGSPNGLRVDPAAVARRLADPGARAGLAEVGFLKPQDVLFQFRADAAELRAYVGEGPILTDDRPLLEYFRRQDITGPPPDLARFSGDQSKVLR